MHLSPLQKKKSAAELSKLFVENDNRLHPEQSGTLPESMNGAAYLPAALCPE